MSATHETVTGDPQDPGWPFDEKDRLLDEHRRELAEARRLLGEKDRVIAQGAAERETLCDRIEELTELLDAAKERVAWFRRQVFGRRSEKIPPEVAEQLLQGFGEIFGFETPEGVKGGVAPPGSAAPSGASPSQEKKEDAGAAGGEKKEEGDWKVVQVEAHERKVRKGHGRKPLPPGLPRVVLGHELEPDERCCSVCGDPMEKIGTEETKLLEFLLPLLFVMVHARTTYACKKSGCQHPKDGQAPSQPVTAPMPPLPIHKGKAGPGMLAQILISKWEDNTPLHRQLKIFLRHGVAIPESTFGDWVAQSAMILVPLAEHIAKKVVTSDIIQTDDTKLPVLPEKSPPGTEKEGRAPKQVSKGHLWAYRSGDKTNPYVAFHFTPTWSAKDGPGLFLKDFRGKYLQADAYKGYDSFFKSKPETEEVGCWAHARRKVHDALLAAPARPKALLLLIQALYRIERRAKDEGIEPEARKILRQQESKPILEKIRAWLDATKPHVTPQSLLGKAITYLDNQWAALLRFLDDGRLEIDNNLTENDLRTIATGRKVWEFAGSQEAAVRSAAIYTVLMSAKRCGLDLHAYLRFVLTELPRVPKPKKGESEEDVRARKAMLDSLLPDRWQAPDSEDERFLAHLGPDILTAFLQSLTLSKPAKSKPP